MQHLEVNQRTKSLMYSLSHMSHVEKIVLLENLIHVYPTKILI